MAKKKQAEETKKAPAKRVSRKKKEPSAKQAPPKTRKTATKKATKKKDPGDPKVRGTGWDPGELPHPMKIRGNLLLRFQAAVAELEAAEAKTQTAIATIQLLRSKPEFAPVFRAQQIQKDTANELVRKRKTMADLQLEIGKKFKIPPEELKHLNGDSTSGVFIYTGPGGKPEG